MWGVLPIVVEQTILAGQGEEFVYGHFEANMAYQMILTGTSVTAKRFECELCMKHHHDTSCLRRVGMHSKTVQCEPRPVPLWLQ